METYGKFDNRIVRRDPASARSCMNFVYSAAVDKTTGEHLPLKLRHAILYR